MRSAVSSRTQSSSTSSSSRASRRIDGVDPGLRVLPLVDVVVLELRAAERRAGSESPWMTSVESTIENARKTISARSGNGPPESVSSGIASAAASVTPPRMPGPADERDELPGRRRIPFTQAARQPPRDVRDREAASEPDGDDDNPEQRGVPEQLLPGETVELVENRSELEADEPEQERVQEEVEDRPEPVALEPRVDGRQLRRVPAHVDACRDDGEHSRHAERSGRQEGDVAGQERDRHLERRVVDAEADEADHPSDHEPDRDPTQRRSRRSLRRRGRARTSRLRPRRRRT